MPRSDIEKEIFSIYYKEARFLKTLDEETVKKLSFLKDCDSNVFKRLVEQNLRFVFFIARKITHRGNISFNDIIQAGNLGLCIALKRFDPNRGTKITTYAESRIRREINYAIFNNNVVPKGITEYTDDLTFLRDMKIEISDKSLTPEQVCELYSEILIKYKFLNHLADVLDLKPVKMYINNDYLKIFETRYGLCDKSFKPLVFKKVGEKYGVSKQAASRAVEKVWDGLYLIKRTGIEEKHRIFLYKILNLERKNVFRKKKLTNCVICSKKLAVANLYNRCFYCFENFF